MSQLFFKKRFQDAIRAGTKRTTIRRWDRPLLQAGQQAFSPGLGWLLIEAVDAVELDALGDDDAGADGFASAAEMKQLLIELYPRHATDQKQWFRIRFHLHAPHESPRRRASDENAPSLF